MIALTSVILLMEENHALSAVTQALCPNLWAYMQQGAVATQYYAVENPYSRPNYIAVTSGSTYGSVNDNPPSSTVLNATSIANSLQAKGIPWVGLSENQGADPTKNNGSTQSVAGPCYAERHNGLRHYNYVLNGFPQNLIDYQLGTWSTNYWANWKGGFAMVAPNLFNDGHTPGDAPHAMPNTDNWVGTEVPKMLASPPMQQPGALLIITFDNAAAGAPLLCLFLGPASIGGGFRDSTVYGSGSPLVGGHYSVLHTIEAGFGLSTLTANDAAAKIMTPMLKAGGGGATAPQAPTSVNATPGDTTLAVTWLAPNDGGSPITDYTVQYRLDPNGTWTTFARGTSTVLSATITGLVDSVPYDIQVRAINAIGSGPYSLVAGPFTPVGVSPPPTFGGGKCVGFYDRQGIPFANNYTNWTNAAFNSILSGFIIPTSQPVTFPGSDDTGGIPWAELQPTAGNPPGTGPINGAAIDHAFDQADAYNNTNPAIPWTLKVRVLCGCGGASPWGLCPSWATALDGGPITAPDAVGAQMPVWWGQAHLFPAFVNFYQALSDYVPQYSVRSSTSSFGLPTGTNTQPLGGHPLLGEVTESLGGDAASEPQIKNFTWSQTQGNPVWSAALERQSQTLALASLVSMWGTTPVAYSSNPYQFLNSGTSNENFTEALIAYLAGDTVGDVANPENLAPATAKFTWPYMCFGNESLRANGLTYSPYADPHAPSYTAMYTRMATYNTLGAAHKALGLTNPLPYDVPISIQTSTYAKMGGTPAALLATIQYGIWLGARCIELPLGYTNIAVGDPSWGTNYAALQNNDPAVGPPAGASQSHRRWRAFRHR